MESDCCDVLLQMNFSLMGRLLVFENTKRENPHGDDFVQMKEVFDPGKQGNKQKVKSENLNVDEFGRILHALPLAATCLAWSDHYTKMAMGQTGQV